MRTRQCRWNTVVKGAVQTESTEHRSGRGSRGLGALGKLQWQRPGGTQDGWDPQKLDLKNKGQNNKDFIASMNLCPSFSL